MSFLDTVNRFFGQMTQVPMMASADAVAAVVPQHAEYVTLGPVIILSDAKEFNGGEAGYERPDKLFGRGNGRDLGYVPSIDGNQQEICYLVLSDDTLQAITPNGEYFSINANQIYALDARQESGFILFIKDGRGLAVGIQTPVQIPAEWHFQTIKGMTNGMFGWDIQLQKYGTKSNW